MGYLVATSGRILLPVSVESQALTVLEVRVAQRPGRYSPDVPVEDLDDLARYAGATAQREGDWVTLSTRKDEPPTWSDQAAAFYENLSGWAREGEVRLESQDGSRWTYLYEPESMRTLGSPPGAAPRSGSAPVVLPTAAPEPPDPAAPVPPAPASESPLPPTGPPSGSPSAPPAWEIPPSLLGGDDEPRRPGGARTGLMVLLLVAGVICIIGLAALVAGL